MTKHDFINIPKNIAARIINEHLAEVQLDDVDKPPRYGKRAKAVVFHYGGALGAGKTLRVKQEILANPDLRFVIFTPTTALAEEFYRDLLELDPEIDAMVWYGRSATNTLTKEPICPHSTAVDAASKMGHDIHHYCEKGNGDNKTFCVHASVCPIFQQQFRDPRVLIGTHANLTRGINRKQPYDVMVIDEDFVDAMLDPVSVGLPYLQLAESRLIEASKKYGKLAEQELMGVEYVPPVDLDTYTSEDREKHFKERRGVERLVAAVRVLRQICREVETAFNEKRRLLYRNMPSIKELRSAVRQIHWSREKDGPTVVPNPPGVEKDGMVHAAKKQAPLRVAAHFLASLVDVMINVRTCGRLPGLQVTLGSDIYNNEEIQVQGAVWKGIDPQFDTPRVEVLSSTPSISIYETLFSGVVSDKAEWQRSDYVRVTRVATSGAISKLLNQKDELEPAGALIHEAICSRAHLYPTGMLIVAQKRMIEALKAAGLPSNVYCDETETDNTENFSTVLGKNKYNDVGAVIVVGRQGPFPSFLQLQAEAISGEIVPVDLETWWEWDEHDEVTRDAKYKTRTVTPKHDNPTLQDLAYVNIVNPCIQANRTRGLRPRESGVVPHLILINDIWSPETVDEIISLEKFASPVRTLASFGVLPIAGQKRISRFYAAVLDGDSSDAGADNFRKRMKRLEDRGLIIDDELVELRFDTYIPYEIRLGAKGKPIHVDVNAAEESGAERLIENLKAEGRLPADATYRRRRNSKKREAKRSGEDRS